MHKINEKTMKHVYTNFCQPELEKIKFPNFNLNLDLLK